MRREFITITHNLKLNQWKGSTLVFIEENVQGHTFHQETCGSSNLGQWRVDECGLLAYRYGNEWAKLYLFAFGAAIIHQRWAQGQTPGWSPTTTRWYSRTHQPSCHACLGINCYHTHRIFWTWLPVIIPFFQNLKMSWGVRDILITMSLLWLWKSFAGITVQRSTTRV